MKISVTLLRLASAAIIFLASRVEAVVINLGGTNYTITASSTTYAAAKSALSSTPWFGNSTLAAEAAGLVGTALGLPNSNPPFVDLGPVFAYEETLDPYGSTRVSSQALQGPVGGPYTVQYRGDFSTDTFYYAAVTPEAPDFTYTATATEVTITGYTGAGGAVVIPASIGGAPVTAIGDLAFSPDYRGIQSITSVTIPNSVKSIGLFAFGNCRSLTSVTIGSGVTSIGSQAFRDCSSLTSVTIPASVTSIGGGAFSGCSGLINIEVDINNLTYTSVGGVLYNKDQTTLIKFPASKSGSYTIPNSVTSIGNEAFAGCTALTSVTIPDSLTSIGNDAFAGCSSLPRVMIPAATVLGNDAFPPTTTILRYLTDAQLASRDSQQNAAGQATGRTLGQADVTNAPGTYGLYTAAQYAANYDSGQAAGQTAGRALGRADVTNAPNTHGLYNLSQVQALNVDAPLLTREAGNNKFKLTIKVKKSTDLKTFSAFPFVFENSTINANGEMEFQFTSSENAAFYRLEAR